ncbi:hypothetical protein CAPTEDRAFT_117023, partial [Capitella teleta]
VPDDKMTASGQYNQYHGPERGRIDTVVDDPEGFQGSWSPRIPERGQWIQVEFNGLMIVHTIRTRGRNEYGQWVKTYSANFSEDGVTWATYQEPYGTNKIFHGNLNSSHVLRVYFMSGFVARGVRFHPTTWNDTVGVRWEVLGCPGLSTVLLFP